MDNEPFCDFPKMEEQKYSLSICESFINQYLMEKVHTNIPPNQQTIATYSLYKSTSLADNIFLYKDYCPDQPRTRLSEDQIGMFNNKKSIRVGQPRKQSKFSTASRRSNYMKTKEENSQNISSFNNAKLTPLETFEDSIHSEDQSEDLESRLRQRKIHQHYFRTRYEQNVKQGVKKKRHGVGKNEGKAHSIVAYDFDGGIIQGGPRQEGIKLPLHYLDLEVQVLDKEQVRDPKKKATKGRQQLKQQKMGKEQIKIAQSHFLKDFNSIHWSNGVEVKQSKGQCRKILGYQNPNILRKRKINLFKQSDSPVRMKFEELASYKKLASVMQESCMTHQNINTRQTQKSIQSSLNSRFYNSDSKSKNITITNTKALQFLIEEDEKKDMKKTGFSKGKGAHFHN